MGETRSVLDHVALQTVHARTLLLASSALEFEKVGVLLFHVNGGHTKIVKLLIAVQTVFTDAEN